MATEKTAHWYVVRTLALREDLVALLLKKQIENPENPDVFVQETMIPTRLVKFLRNGKVVEKNRKLFPGYVFVKMIRTTQTWYAVRFTYGVTGFVGMNKRPTAISATARKSCMILWILRFLPSCFPPPRTEAYSR